MKGREKTGLQIPGDLFQNTSLHPSPLKSISRSNCSLGHGLHPDFPFPHGLLTESLAKDSHLLPFVQNHLLSQKKSFPPVHS